MEDRKYVISLYDYTGEALKPWAEAGYICFAYDIQHTERTEMFDGGGRITYKYADLHNIGSLDDIWNTLILSGQIMAQIIGCTLLWPFLSVLTWLYQVRHTSSGRLNVTHCSNARRQTMRYGVLDYSKR